MVVEEWWECEKAESLLILAGAFFWQALRQSRLGRASKHRPYSAGSPTYAYSAGGV